MKNSTPMLKRYMLKLIFRVSVFVSILVTYIVDRDLLYELTTMPIRYGITPLHVLWVVFMLIMIKHLFPTESVSMAVRKAKVEHFQEVKGYDCMELYQFVQQQNERAWKVMLVWLSFNAVFGALYLFGVLHESDLLMLTVFYFLCDYICILFFCPFQSIIMKNKCCVNCRIFDWGHFMMFTPMLFIRNFFSWSLFFTSLVVLIHWEIEYTKHPERFWEGSNQVLKCANCKDRTCQIKNTLAKKQNS